MDEGTKSKVIFKPKAEQSIVEIAIYIASKGYPETALKVMERLYTFGQSLTIFPNKYPTCTKKILAKRHFHCAVFDKNYIFIYKVVAGTLTIYNVISAKTYST